MPFHNAFMIRLFETGDFCAGFYTAVNSNKYTNCADEIFIQSILKKSPYFKNLYRKTTYDFYGNMRLVDFKRGNPYTWLNSDLSEIIASKYLFIRKVDDRVDNVLIENLMKF